MKPLSEAALGSPSMPMMSAGAGALPPLQSIMPEPSARMEQIMKPHKANPEDEQLQKVLTRLTEDSPSSVAEIIQMWLAEDEKRV